ncbi:MAG: thiol-disulfide oxidoreductase DCC family protein [Polyangiaceae bacterium]|nr:thiol-disulfide oxidoreductase DCC family protein [Polyangiaceae bacterium]
MGPVVLFDGVCNLCNGWVNFVIDRDPRGTLRFASLQSEAGARLLESVGATRDPLSLDTIVLVDGGRVYERSTAVLRVVRHLRWPWSWAVALLVVPRPIRDSVYRWVASHRYSWFGRSEVCRVPTPELRARFLAEGSGDASGGVPPASPLVHGDAGRHDER